MNRDRIAERLRGKERAIAVSISTALVMMGQGILGPVLPLFARDLGFGATAAGAAVGAFALARLLFNVPLGVLSDARGRRLLIVGGPLVVAVGMVGSGLADSIITLIIWRFVAGLGSSMYMTGSLAYLVDIATETNRTRLLAVNQAALLIGVSVGPSLGGLVAAELGLRAPFFVVAAAALTASVYGYFRMPETLTHDPDSPRPGYRSKTMAGLRALHSAPFLAIAVANFAYFLTRGTAPNTLLPLVAVDVFGLSVDQVGLLLGAMALMSLLLLPFASSIADRWGRAQVIVPSLVLTSVSLAIIGLATGTGVFVFGSLVLGFASAVAGPAPAAYAAEVSSPKDRGLAMGAFRTAGDLGLLLGPPLLGAVADTAGYPWAFGVDGIMVLLSALALGVVALGRPRSRAGQV
ncbi:MAG: MFS transporter [Acidimicrobiia bacterium]